MMFSLGAAAKDERKRAADEKKEQKRKEKLADYILLAADESSNSKRQAKKGSLRPTRTEQDDELEQPDQYPRLDFLNLLILLFLKYFPNEL